MRSFQQACRAAFAYSRASYPFSRCSRLSRGWSSFAPTSRIRRGSPVPRASVTLRASMIPFLSSWLSSSSSSSEKMPYPDQRSEEQWRAVLSPEQFRILRQKGTEPPGTGEYDKHSPSSGIYECAGCGTPLYKASHKFASGCGWPAYFDSLPGAVTRHEDNSLGMSRTEIVCSNCGGHLGHVFKGEGYPTPTDERHCVNSVSIKFSEDERKVDEK